MELVDPRLADALCALFAKYTDPGPPRTALYAELDGIGFAKYCGLLTANGFDRLREVKEVEAEDLMALGVPIWHGRALLAAIPAPGVEIPKEVEITPEESPVRTLQMSTPVIEVLQQPPPQPMQAAPLMYPPQAYQQPQPQPLPQPQPELYQAQHQPQPIPQAQQPQLIQQPQPLPQQAPLIQQPQLQQSYGTVCEDLDGWEMGRPGETVDLTAPLPQTWEQCGVHPTLAHNARSLGWMAPRPVQRILLHHTARGVGDYIVAATTGCGKTGAYLLPMLSRLLYEGPHNIRGTYCVILLHTLELSDQVCRIISDLTRETGIHLLPALKNVPDDQLREMAKVGPCHIVVGTAGKIAKILAERDPYLNFMNTKVFVVDEADALAVQGNGDRGMMKGQLGMIFKSLPRDTASFTSIVASATLHGPLRKLCGFKNIEGTYDGEPIVGSNAWLISDASMMECKANVFQEVRRVESYQDKVQETLRAIDDTLKFPEAKIVVVAQKDLLSRLKHDLEAQLRGVEVLVTTGDHEAVERCRVFNRFKENKIPTVLIGSSGIVSRGADIFNCLLVVLFSAPTSFTNYKHAIGRTGRGTQTGRSLLLYKKDEIRWNAATLLRDFINQSPAKGRHIW